MNRMLLITKFNILDKSALRQERRAKSMIKREKDDTRLVLV